MVPDLYVGLIAGRMGGVDIGWLVGAAVSAVVYLRFNPARRAVAIALLSVPERYSPGP